MLKQYQAYTLVSRQGDSPQSRMGQKATREQAARIADGQIEDLYRHHSSCTPRISLSR